MTQLLDVLVLGFALAMDAAVATFALGVLGAHHKPAHKIAGAFYLACLFGLFQFLMLWGGSHGGYYFTFSSYGHLFQLAVAGVFFVIGSKVIIDSFADEEKKLSWGLIPTLLIAVATSIDALAAGISLATMPQSWVVALEVGVITFGMSLLFYFFSQITQTIPERWLQRVAGIIFLIMGAKVVLDYMRLGGLL